MLVTDAVLVAPETILSVTMEGVPGVQPAAIGFAMHGSMPCKLTVTLGDDPLDVINVQLPEPGAIGWLRSAVITTVV